MSLALFANYNFPLDEVISAFRREGIDVFPVRLDSHLQARGIPASVDKGVLIIPEQGVINVGEQAGRVRKLIGTECFLILCTPEPTVIDRQLLFECGASEIVTPSAWSPSNVTERILSELIIKGYVQPSSFGDIQGATCKMRELYYHIQKVASLSEPILILGETGTGKELVAAEVHKQSERPNPFLPINCPELSPELLGSELFGHERGAFTGAIQSRKGLLVEAGKGTIFLDEIGDLDTSAQAKLLRVIENHVVRPVGANKWQEFHARIILATNRNLPGDCVEGRFRQDLFERIRGFALELPPLRERKADIPLLVRHFIKEYENDYSGQINISSGALDCLFEYNWPGNVRELRAVVRKAAAYADGAGNISTAFLQEAVRNREGLRAHNSINFDPSTDSWRDLLSRAQAIYFRAVLAESGGNKETAARLAGLSRSQFYEKLKELEKIPTGSDEKPKTKVQ